MLSTGQPNSTAQFLAYRDVCPCCAVYDFTSIGLRYSVLIAQPKTIEIFKRIVLAHREYAILSQFRAMVLAACRPWMRKVFFVFASALGHRVSVVVSIVSGVDVGWIKAPLIISTGAVVTGQQRAKIYPVIDGIHNSTNVELYPTDSEMSVPATPNTPFPSPAFIISTLVDFLPKSCSLRFGKGWNWYSYFGHLVSVKDRLLSALYSSNCMGLRVFYHEEAA